ncbi:MAG: VCBS repeat-containing protein [Candidatus Sabulitectum sp.]|nr:VCBS repeat-containing protein [Candidatus Sabulitectum sp.]
MFILLITLVLFSPSYADFATQSDWSGGSIPGPVINWENQFYSQSGMEYLSYPGSLILGYDPVEHIISESVSAPTSVFAADIDSDGDIDILCASSGDDKVEWWENANGSGTSWQRRTIAEGFDNARSACTADINGDGYPDVLGAAYNQGITWWENVDSSGTIWTEHIVSTSFNGAYSAVAEDIDGDGDIDILGGADCDSEVSWWENTDGFGTAWTKHIITDSLAGVMAVYADDVDGDGDIDALSAAHADDELSWWENTNGSGTSWERHFISDLNAGCSVNSVDLDGDGDTDVLATSFFFGEISWWENVNGSGTSWNERIIDTDFEFARSIYGKDIDGDGDIDVLGASYIDNSITWWENIGGSGFSWIEHPVSIDFAGAHSVYAADVDGDGNTDVIGAASASGEIAWWDPTVFSNGGFLESSILDVLCIPDWQTISWNCDEPSGTSVAFQVRASDDFSSMGIWSDTLGSPANLEGIIEDGNRFFQYRAILSRSDLLATPTLNDITVAWNPTGMESEDTPTGFALYGTSRNPSSSNPLVSFSLPVDCRADLMVFNFAGRLVRTESDEFKAGIHYIPFHDLGNGIYLILLHTCEYRAIRRFTVIE